MRTLARKLIPVLLCGLLLAGASCAAEDPVVPDAGGDSGPPDSGPGPDTEPGPDTAGPDSAGPDTAPPDSGPTDGGPDAVTPDGGDGGGCLAPVPFKEDISACQPLASDYMPRVNMSQDDTWPACISDDNVFHQVEPTVSSIARTEAFEDIGDLLWKKDTEPSARDFIDARVIYAVDQGIDSRVQRRMDYHYAEVPGGASCTDAGVAEQYPDRCVGPGRLLPIVNEAFVAGAGGEAPRVNAARLEAALLWFFYASVFSEVNSCIETPRDCDSQWAYYAGGTPRESPIGLGRYVDEIGPGTHDRVYDGLLAVRCWRNLDNETGTATDLVTRARAEAQLDVALIRGMGLIVRQRLLALACATGDRQEAHFAFVTTLLPFLDRAARAIDATLADTLADAADATRAGDLDTAAAVAALDELFPCP